MALTVVYVPYSLDNGAHTALTHYPTALYLPRGHAPRPMRGALPHAPDFGECYLTLTLTLTLSLSGGHASSFFFTLVTGP